MKNLKKVLALVLAFACAFTMFAGAAFTDQADIKATDAVNMLSSLGVITGYTDGSYQPNKVVTRAEMAKMIFVVRNNKIDDSAYQSNYSKLTDISNHWAKGYIKFCESQGIIAGKGNNKFDPDSPVTGVEAAKMLLVVAGYDTDKAGLTGSAWRTNTLKYAGAAGILDDVNAALEQGLPRQYAAQMIYNTLDVNRVKWSKDSESFDDVLNGGVKETVGHAYMGLSYDYGTLVSIDKDNLEIVLDKNYDADNYHAWSNASGAANTVKFTKVGEDYTELMGQKVKVMFKDGKTNNVLGVYAVSDNTTYTAVMNDVEKSNGKLKIDGSTYSVDKTGITTYVNGVALASKLSVADFDGQHVADEVTFVDSDGDNNIDTAVITTVDVAKVTYASSSSIIANGKTYKYEDENIADGLKKDDWVIITENLFDDCKDIVKADMINGKVTGTKSGKYAIDGTWYRVTDTSTTYRTLGYSADLNSVKAGDTVEAVAVNGVLFYAKRTNSVSGYPDIAMVVAKGEGVQGKLVKLAFVDGTTKVVTLDEDPTYAVAQSAIKAGGVYEYSVSGDKYALMKLVNTADQQQGIAVANAKDYYGDYTATTNGSAAVDAMTFDEDNGKVTGLGGSALSTNNGTLDTIGANNNKVDDSAKVFLFDSVNEDVKVITGKQYKNMTSVAVDSANGESQKVVQNSGLFAFTSKVDGLTKATILGVLIDGTIPNQFTSNNGYAILTGDAQKVDNSHISFEMFNGSETKTVTVKASSETLYKKGVVIGYGSIDENNVMDDVNIINNMIADSVSGMSNSKAKVTMDKLGDQIEIDDDVTALYISTNEDGDITGVVDGEPVEAAKNGDTYCINALYDNASACNVLVIDVTGKMHNDEQLTSALKTLSIASGKATSVVVKDEDGDVHTQNPSDKVFMRGETITVSGKATAAATLTVSDAVLAVNGSTTATLTAGDEFSYDLIVTGADVEITIS